MKKASKEDLVTRFEQLASERALATRNNDTRSANKAFDKETAILRELERRDPDNVRLLLPLLKSTEAWIRCDSAIPLLFFSPEEGAHALERIVREEEGIIRATASVTLDQWWKGKLERWWNSTPTKN
jgi:hypothetical protein